MGRGTDASFLESNRRGAWRVPFRIRQWGEGERLREPALSGTDSLYESRARALPKVRKAGNDEGLGSPLQEPGKGGDQEQTMKWDQ